MADNNHITESQLKAFADATANQMNRLSKKVVDFSLITGFNWKGNKDTYADLLLLTDLEANDGYGVIADGLVYVWNGESFQPEGEGMDLGLKPSGIVEEGNTQAVSGEEVYDYVKEVNDDLVQLAGNPEGLLLLSQGGISQGEWVESDTRLFSEKITGAFALEVKSGYIISFIGIFNNNNGSYDYEEIVGNRVYYEIPENHYARIVIRKEDQNEIISPNEDIINVYKVHKEKRIVNANSFMNAAVKELYLYGTDEDAEYIIISLSNNPEALLSNFSIAQVKDGIQTTVLRYRQQGGKLDNYISFIPQQAEQSIGGYAVVDWEALPFSPQAISSEDNYVFNTVRDIDFSPIIKSYIQSEDTGAIEKTVFDLSEASNGKLRLNQGRLSDGEWVESDTRVYSEKITGAFALEVKSGYIISFIGIFNNNNGSYDYEEIVGNRVYYEIPENHYARIVIRKEDINEIISPNEDIISSFINSKEKTFIDGYSLLNYFIKELYLIGLKENEKYIIHVLSNNPEALLSNFAISWIKKGEDGEPDEIIPVARYKHTNGMLDNFLHLSAVEGSGVHGYAIVDWVNMPLEPFSIWGNVDKYPINDRVKDIRYSPTIENRLSVGTDEKLPIILPLTSYVSTTRNYILKEEDIDGVTMLGHSNDLGVTWKYLENTIGNISFVHWFKDGTCMICGNEKVYYTKDWESFNETEVYDYDGSVFLGGNKNFFNLRNYNSKYVEINGIETLIWVDYGGPAGYVSRMWMSQDNGKTLRCILKNGEELADGSTLSIRHFHGCIWDEFEHCLWVTTGDSATQCHVIKGTFDTEWQFEILATGDNFKFTEILYDKEYVGFVTDFTVGTIPTGIIMVDKSKVGDEDSYFYLYKDMNAVAYSKFFVDSEGHRVLTPDGIGYNRLWYAYKDFNFEEKSVTFENDEGNNRSIGTLIGANYNGDVICRSGDGYNITDMKLNIPTRYLFSKGMRDANYKDFGKVIPRFESF